MYIGQPDFQRYPETGDPFADYWGKWVERQCPTAVPGETVACCFEMGGCADGRPYPPPRLAPPNKARNDMDPSLAYDVSEYGHLGYDQEQGPPDPERPVQAQYKGTWAIWSPPNADERVGNILADHVADFVSAQ